MALTPPPGGLPVLSRIVTRQDRKLPDGLYAQVAADHAARRAIRIVIDANTIMAVVILLWRASGDRHLRPEAAIPPVMYSVGRLGFDFGNVGLETC